jgi:hypothetical protein
MAVDISSPSSRSLWKTIAPAIGLASALAVLLALTPAGHATPATTVANSVTFTDSTGEDALAPDITTVVVSNDDKGTLTFVINTPNRPTLTADMAFIMFVDSDSNTATGEDGTDYILQLFGPLEGRAEIGLFRWNGTDFVSTGVSQATLVFSYANGATIRLNNSELGGTKRFGFLTLAISGIALTPTGELDLTNIHRDFAPERGIYTYDVKITPPTLVVKTFGMRPPQPRAGRPFSVFLTFARSDAAAPTTTPTATCKATLGGRALRASASTVAGARATCTWAIPKTAKGKTIRGTVTVQADGLKKARPFTAKVV